MQDNKARYRENQFNIGREERAQIRESQRGSNPARGYEQRSLIDLPKV